MVRRLIQSLSRGQSPAAAEPPPPAPEAILPPDRARAVEQRYRNQKPPARISYATVADFCDSVDHLPEITGRQGDLKDVQRPWAVKMILALVPRGATLVEIGAGMPDVAQALVDCGYRVIAVDPYEGAGNGPTEYEAYKARFPRVDIRRQLFDETLDLTAPVDAVYSISTLEHIDDLEPVFRAIRKFLKPETGLSVHCMDVVTRGMDDAYHLRQAAQLLHLHGEPGGAWDALLQQANQDLETYFLGPSGHQLWRGATPYEKFPYRKVLSLQSYARTPDLLLPGV
jgi:2-polyprenyl-3-methyl-5-hydroxy-6-metoxy-1,4-benzoquinol methylase